MKKLNMKKGKKAVKPANNLRKKKKMPKSSSSNPASKHFREAAKKKQGFGPRFMSQAQNQNTFAKSKALSGSQSALTLETLEKHNAVTGGFTESMVEDDTTSFGGTTFNTWATNMTGCTNATFNRVHRYINSTSSLQKEILAVLAAVTEVIKEKGGEGKDVQYFAVLVTSLQEADKQETKMATVHLLSIVIKKVPFAVLQSSFGQVLKVLMTLTAECVKTNNLAPLKPTLLCLASLLRVQPPSVWTDSSTEQAYRALLAFVTHKKPKLRKAAQKAILIVVRGCVFMQGEEAPQYHPAASITAKHCQKEIESSGGISNRVDILHVLSLVKETIGLFPYAETKSLCEVLLRLMTLTDLIVRSSCMEVLYRLFLSNPNAKSLPAKMNGQILTALYDYQPSENDSQPIIAWLTLMKSAAVCLASRDRDMCLGHLPKLFSTCMTCLLSDRQDVASAAVSAMKALLTDCIALVEDKLCEENFNSPVMISVQKVVKAMATGLSYQFHSTWSQVFQLWATGFLVIGKIAPQMLTKCLTSMGDLRDTPHFSYKGDMDKAIGAAVKSMGPKIVLQSIPLQITGEDDNLEFPRSWLLPVIRDNVTHTQLGFFTSYFLPLAAKMKSTSEACGKENRVAESEAYDTLQQQIWSMLKGFCDHPTDLKQSFQGIAKTLGTALNNREDLRMDVMTSLRSLIHCSLENEEDKREIGRFAKNYLPILFNQYTTEGILNKGTRLAVLEATKKFLLVSDAQLIASFLDKCLDKLKEENMSSFRNIALIDLARTMVSYADEQRLLTLFKLCTQRVKVATPKSDRTVQKKAYRILEEICGSESENCVKLIKSKFLSIRKTLVDSLSKASPIAKAPRLRCLAHIFKKLTECDNDFLMSTIPEAIVCTKEVAVKARVAAYDLIVVMSETFLQWNGDKPEADVLDDFVGRLSAGLVGSPDMISATVLALTRVLYEYKDRLAASTIDFLVKNICVLLNSKNREVIKAGVGFIKVLLTAFDNTVLAAHLKDLLGGMEEIAIKGSVRRLTKIIFVKLIRKFGFEIIVNMTNQKVHKLIKNIQKTQDRKKRKAGAGDDDDDDDDDDNEDAGDENKPRKGQPESIDELLQDSDSELEDDEDYADKLNRRQEKKREERDAWLMETGEDDDIIDFTDPSAVKQISMTRPKAGKAGGKSDRNKSDRGFKQAPDGKFIITDNEREGVQEPTVMSDDDLDDLFEKYEEGLKNKTRNALKRKRGLPVEGVDEEEDDLDAPSSKYKAGGSGIHRPNAKGKKSDAIGVEYKSKKAHGDVTKVGKHEPYAYLPLQFSTLNKRKHMKVKGTYKNLVKGAKKGAGKGAKGKTQNTKRK